MLRVRKEDILSVRMVLFGDDIPDTVMSEELVEARVAGSDLNLDVGVRRIRVPGKRYGGERVAVPRSLMDIQDHYSGMVLRKAKPGEVKAFLAKGGRFSYRE